MPVSKLDLMIVVLLAGGLIWIEHRNHGNIDMSAAKEGARRTAAVCPENESVPHSAECFDLIEGAAESDLRWQFKAPSAASLPSGATGRADLRAPPCPANNENVPYTPNCLKFMSGWFWQANPARGAP
jgi:hypothetical protein